LPFRTRRNGQKYPITVRDIIAVNNRFIHKQDISSIPRLQKIVASINAQTTIENKAALILWGITNDQNFFEGNKRTAWTLTIAFLKKTGYDLPYDSEIEEFLWNTARGLTSLDEAKALVKRKIIPK
jgi:death-on-curing protein